MSFRSCLLVVLLFLLAAVPFAAMAQQPAPAAAGATVHGMVVDPDDALVPDATVTLTPAGAGKTPQTTTSKSDGTYTFRGVPAGTYIVTVTASGFAAFVKEGIKVSVGQNLSVDASLVLAEESQQMTVTADTVQLSVDPDNNSSSTVITGDALNALSDDPDELATELAALAGPSAGPNGGQIYIDGFTGGQLPPKSSILAIRINSNPFSAQYDQPGYGRIEIITKPGTDKFHGSGSFQFQDKFLNTSNPFLGSTNNQPEYHTIFGLANITGPIRPGMAFTLAGSYRDIQNNVIINPTAIYSSSPTSTVMCAPGLSTLGTCTSNPYPTSARAVAAPQTRWDINPRLDTMVGSKNTLTARFEYESNTSTSNGGGNSLPTLGSKSNSSEITFQLSDTQLWSNSVINETRFEFQRDTSGSNPFNTSPGISVQGIVNAGGTGGGSINSNTSDHIEVQNYTSVQLLKNFIRLGARLRTTGESISSNGGANGSLIYSYLLDPCTDPNSTNKTNCTTTTTPCLAANVSIYSSYQCGNPFEFSQTTINNLTINARQTDFEPYAEDDWKVKNNLTISYGVRLEVQNFINSTHDFAPRTSLAYGVPRKNGKTTTVLRAGFGIFYTRFGLGQIAGLVQNNGLNQNDLLYTNPGTACTPTTITGCTAGTGSSAARPSVAAAGNGLRSSYLMETAGTVEQQVGKYASVTVTYLNARGEHQFLTRTFPGTANVCPIAASSAFYVNCTQSEGIFRQNQINTNINVRTPKGTSIFGYYSANWADSNLSGITDPFHPAVDYGRATFAVRSRLSLGGTIPLPFLITASPLIFAQSGSPYNVTTGSDNNLDGNFDDRPSFANGATSGNCFSASTFNARTSTTPVYTPGETYTEVPINYCTGPANVAFNLRLNRTFGFGPKTAPTPGRGGGAGGAGGAGGPGGPGGGGPGGGGFGGGGGGRGGGGGARGGGGGGGGGGRSGSNTGRKYNLTIGAQALNLFNEVPYANPISTLSSPLFGKSTQLAGGQFSGATAVRRITLQANFYF
jgi:Carboxypeptidase regulatory-like domain